MEHKISLEIAGYGVLGNGRYVSPEGHPLHVSQLPPLKELPPAFFPSSSSDSVRGESVGDTKEKVTLYEITEEPQTEKEKAMRIEREVDRWRMYEESVLESVREEVVEDLGEHGTQFKCGFLKAFFSIFKQRNFDRAPVPHMIINK